MAPHDGPTSLSAIARSSDEAPDPSSPVERIEKLEGARRQLETAIWLRFRGGDLASIHTLTAAAYEVIRHLNAAAGGAPVLKDIVHELLPKVLSKEADLRKHRKLLNAPEVFLKHGGRGDRGTSHDFDPRWTDTQMYEAAVRCANLDSVRPLLVL
jgi:hypothetical protein